MPDQFTVPQFIDAEDKIIGPITARQFIIMLVGFLLDALLYKLLTFVWFLAIGIPVIAVTGIFAFARINGMPFHYFLINLIQTLRKPRLRVWDKRLSDAEVRAFMGTKEMPPTPPAPRKPSLSGSRLQELALVVNTGGAYTPDE